jgi:hypothetical protein
MHSSNCFGGGPAVRVAERGTSRSSGKTRFIGKHPIGMARSKHPQVELFVGTSGYSYPDWKGIVYPRSLKREVGGTTPELTYLSRYFNTCEINATYYRPPAPSHAAGLVGPDDHW